MRFDDEAERRRRLLLGRVAPAARSIDAPLELSRIQRLGIRVMDRVVSFAAGRAVHTAPVSATASMSATAAVSPAVSAAVTPALPTLTRSTQSAMPRSTPLAPSAMLGLGRPGDDAAHPTPTPAPTDRHLASKPSGGRLLLVARDPQWGFVSWALPHHAGSRDAASIRLRVVESSTGVVVVSETLALAAIPAGRRYFRLPTSRHALVAYVERVTNSDEDPSVELLRSVTVLGAAPGPERPSPDPLFLGADHLRRVLATHVEGASAVRAGVGVGVGVGVGADGEAQRPSGWPSASSSVPSASSSVPSASSSVPSASSSVPSASSSVPSASSSVPSASSSVPSASSSSFGFVFCALGFVFCALGFVFCALGFVFCAFGFVFCAFGFVFCAFGFVFCSFGFGNGFEFGGVRGFGRPCGFAGGCSR
ncbi:MAG: hypothetical protein H6729_08630 [Deltaproteobacteria bacterium]|nr:hypothetical protein [Deltaproteobacteria bacterium]